MDGKGKRSERWGEKKKKKMKKRKVYVDGMQNGVTGGNCAIYIT